MGKGNNTQFDAPRRSWNPGMVTNTTGMISKNKKRKEKRLSLNLNSNKLNSGATPSKKSTFGQFSKIKENLNLGSNLPFQGKKKEKILSMSLPIKSNEKFAGRSPQKKNARPTGILSNANTPKGKSNKVTFNLLKNVDKFIDNEAGEGEEPITDKDVKPYTKGSQKRKLQKIKAMQSGSNSNDSESESDSSLDDNPESFLEMEASEGEETDEEELDSDDELLSNDDYLSNSDDDDLSDLVNDEEDDVDDDDDHSENNSDEDSEVEKDNKNKLKPASLNRRESVASIPTKKEKKDTKSTSQSIKVNVKAEPGTPQPQKVVKTAPSTQSKKVEAEPKTLEDKNVKKAESIKEKTQQSTVKNENEAKGIVEKDTVNYASLTLSPYAGFIRRVAKDVSDDDVKTALSTRIEAQNIVGFVTKKSKDNRERSLLVYLKNEESLDALQFQEFVVNENFKFSVYKARESIKKTDKFLAFLPRVPLTVTNDELKQALAKDVGADAVKSVSNKRVYPNFQVRNLIVEFSDMESLQKMVQKGECRVGATMVIIRTAFETGIQIPTFRVVFSSVPPKTLEATLKKAIESQVGKSTVLTVRFSVRKPSFAFISMKNEEAQKKALEVGNNITINGTKLQVEEFVARLPKKKRAAPSQQAKEKKKEAKKRKREDGMDVDSPKPAKRKRKKNARAAHAAAVENGDAILKAKVEKNKRTPGPDAKNGGWKEAQQNSTASDMPAKFKKNKKFPKASKGDDEKHKSPSPVKEAVVNGTSPSSPKKNKKKKKKANVLPSEPSPKPVDAKKKILALKLEEKKRNNKKKKVQQKE